MNVIVGDNTGLLKYVSLKTKGQIKKMGTQDRARGGINAMCWAGLQNIESEVAIGLGNGSIEVWNMGTQEMTAQLEGVALASKDDKFVGLHVLRPGATDANAEITRRVVSAVSSGTARITPWVDGAIEAVAVTEEELEGLAPSQAKALRRQREKDYAEQLRQRQELIDAESVEWSLGRHVEKTRLSPACDVLAAGGKENKVALYDLETQSMLFRAKNLPNDFLNLAQPNWDMDFAFFSPGCHQQYTPSGKQDYKIAVSNAYHKIRIYDVKASKRPVVDVEIGAHPARAIAASSCGNYIIAGDAAGRLQKLDVRYNLRQVGVFRGQCGSVREVQVHPTLPMVASVGLDRHLRIHDIDTRKLLKEVYLTQKLTGCLFSAVEPSKRKARSAVADTVEEKESDEVWDELEKGAVADKNNKSEVNHKQTTKAAVSVQRKHVADAEDEDAEEDEDDMMFEEEDSEEVEVEMEMDKARKPKATVKETKESKTNTARTLPVSKPVDEEEEEDVEEDVEGADEDMEEDNEEDMDVYGMDEGDEGDMLEFDEDDEDMDMMGDEDEDEDEDDFQPFTAGFKILGAGNSVIASGVKSAPNELSSNQKSKAPPTAAQNAQKKQRR